ncbi:trypsin-like peptidase domain-containing protein [Thermodesulfobacteriota bacterium]
MRIERPVVIIIPFLWAMALLTFIGLAEAQKPDLDARFYFDRGLAYWHKGLIDESIGNYTKAIIMDPKFTEAYGNRGLACLVKGVYDQAISDFQKALEIDPNFVDAYINRGVAWGIRGYHDRAIADHNKAREITGKDIPSKISLTQGYISFAVKKVWPAIVNIRIGKTTERGTDFFEKFFGDQSLRDRKVSGLGSGFIIDEEGFITTNNHVVEGAGGITITLADGREFDAMVIGRVPEADLALIKIKSKGDLPFATLGDSNNLKFGQWVIAIGNPFGFGIAASAGIIDNDYSDSSSNYSIRTTSNINPGNSGGALINLNGEVVGINTFGSSQGFFNGNAIPINMAKDLVVELKKNDSVSDTKLAQIKQRGMLSTRQFGKESYENSSVVDKTQLQNWINKEFIPYRIKSVVLIIGSNRQIYGSGFFIDKDGFILTNNHVVEMGGDIVVKLVDGREFDAKVIGQDPRTDSALIGIESDLPFEPLYLGNSDELEVGNWVVPVGYPISGMNIPVTAGILSAKFRSFGTGYDQFFIQTAAPINFENSGSPLLNLEGEVIGINTAIYSREKGGAADIGCAIPIKMVKDLLPQLKKGKVVRGWLGVLIQEITPVLKEAFKLKDTQGAMVGGVTEGSPAEKAGIERGDVIISFDGKKVGEIAELLLYVAATPVGKKVDVEVVRKGKKKKFEVEIGELKDETAE